MFDKLVFSMNSYTRSAKGTRRVTESMFGRRRAVALGSSGAVTCSGRRDVEESHRQDVAWRPHARGGVMHRGAGTWTCTESRSALAP